jgi:hypothetical protein
MSGKPPDHVQIEACRLVPLRRLTVMASEAASSEDDGAGGRTARDATLSTMLSFSWCLAVPSMVAALPCLWFPFVLPKFRHMFDALHASLPLVTRIALSVPAMGWIIATLGAAAGLVWCLLECDHHRAKVVAAILCGGMIWGQLCLGAFAIYAPMHALQLALQRDPHAVQQPQTQAAH